ncbi:hypothetical protein JZU68_03795, partial [bacterium]|nr:hypothetical protein [bacterium]
VDIQNVDQALVRPDLGFKLTNEGYKKYGEDEQKFNAEYGNVVSSNTEAIGTNKALLSQIDQAAAGLTPKSVDPLWEEAKKGFVAVHAVPNKPMVMVGAQPGEAGAIDLGPMASLAKNAVVGSTWVKNVPNPEIQYTKYYPKEVVDSLHSAFNKQGSFPGQWINGAYYVGDEPIGTASSDRYGKELQDTLVSAENQTKTAFYEQMSPKINEYNAGVTKQLGDYSTKKAEVQSYIDTSEDAIGTANMAKESRGAQKEAYKQQYQESVGKRQALFR